MTCHRIEPLLIREVCQALAERESALLQAHLAGCRGCSARLAGLSAGRELLSELDEVAVPGGMVQLALDRRHARRAWKPQPVLLRRIGLAAASCGLAAALGTGAYQAFRAPSGESQQQSATTRPSRTTPGTKPARQETAISTPRNPALPGSGSERRLVYRGTRGARAENPSSPHGLLPKLDQNRHPADELCFLSGSDPGLVARWMTGDARDPAVRDLLERLGRIEVKDDFVRVPLPQLASADAKQPAVAGAIRKYEAEAKVVDPRLYRKITLKLKGCSLEEFCQAFEKETGVRARPSRGVADEKLTVLVDDLHARVVMRAVARLFGYFWSRSGTEGAYRYEVYQDLKSQLAEEEMRNRDLNGALLAVDSEMQAYMGSLDLTLEQLKTRAAAASGKEKERLERLMRGGWGVAQVYRHLAPAEIAALRSGQMLTFSSDNAAPGRQLPPEWRSMLFATSRTRELDFQSGQPVEVGDLPDARVLVDLQLKRSELGQVTLEGAAAAFSPSTGMGGGILRPLVIGQSPSVANPANAGANAALRNKAPFTRVVTLRPEPQCPNLKRWYPFGTTFGSGAPNEGAMEAPRPHVDSAEVWEEVHRRSGLPIIADYYTRQHDLQAVTLERGTLFEGLCRIGDKLGVRWHQDGGILLCRSTSYFWDKLKEVPNRQVRRWQAEATTNGGLPLRDLLEMSALSDAQLNSTVTAPGIRQCCGLEEWGIVGGGEHRPLRAHARFLAQLRPEQLNLATSAAGLPLAGLTPDQQREWLRIQPSPPPGSRLRVDYVPAGVYVWVPTVPSAEIGERLSRLPLVAGKTSQEALAAARRHYPEATERQFRRSLGVLAVTVEGPTGESHRQGKPPVLLLPPNP